MSTVSEIEDAVINAIEALGVFNAVHSVGRKELPSIKSYPAAYVFFVSDRDTGARPRPVVELTYDVVAVVKNLRSEAEAAKDAYAVIDAARDAVNGKTLGMADIEPFVCASRNIAGYEAGVIEYALRFTTRHYLPVPGE